MHISLYIADKSGALYLVISFTVMASAPGIHPNCHWQRSWPLRFQCHISLPRWSHHDGESCRRHCLMPCSRRGWGSHGRAIASVGVRSINRGTNSWSYPGLIKWLEGAATFYWISPVYCDCVGCHRPGDKIRNALEHQVLGFVGLSQSLKLLISVIF